MTSFYDSSTLYWAGNGGPSPASGLTSLAPYNDSRIDAEIADHQVALLLDSGEVVGTLLPGRHVLLVGTLNEDGPPVDHQPRQDDGEDEYWDLPLNKAHVVSAYQHLLFLNLSPMPASPWGESQLTSFQDAEIGDVAIRAAGSCQLRVQDPLRFYHSFLCHTEDLSEDDFVMVSQALVHGSFSRALGKVTQHLQELEQNADALVAASARHMRKGFETVGLSLEDFTLQNLDTSPFDDTAELDSEGIESQLQR